MGRLAEVLSLALFFVLVWLLLATPWGCWGWCGGVLVLGVGFLLRLYRRSSGQVRLALEDLGAGGCSFCGSVEEGWGRRLATSTSWRWLGEVSPPMVVHRRQIPVAMPDGCFGLQRRFAAMGLRPASGVWWLRLLPFQDRFRVVGGGWWRKARWQLAPGESLACVCAWVFLCFLSSV